MPINRIDQARRGQYEAQPCGDLGSGFETHRDTQEIAIVADREIIRHHAHDGVKPLAIGRIGMQFYRLQAAQKIRHVTA